MINTALCKSGIDKAKQDLETVSNYSEYRC